NERVCGRGFGSSVLPLRRAIAAGSKIPGDAGTRQQSAHERRIRFVELYCLFALGIPVQPEAGREFAIEGARQCWVNLRPFFQHDSHDLWPAQASEYTRVDTMFHDRQGVTDDELITGDRTVAFARTGLRDQPADFSQRTAIVDEFQCGG